MKTSKWQIRRTINKKYGFSSSEKDDKVKTLHTNVGRKIFIGRPALKEQRK